jgi:hypothetical protein
MASSGIRFVKLPKPLQERLTRVMKAIEKGIVDPDWGGELFLKYFAYRFGIIAERSPHADQIYQAAKGMHLGLIIKGTAINHLATFGDTISEIIIERNCKLSDPTMIFNNMDIFLDVILSRKDLLRAGIEKQVEIRKMAVLFKWMAPVVALQDDATQAILEEKCPPMLEGIVAQVEQEYNLE